MIVENYYKFEIEKYISDYHDNMETLQSLKEQLQELEECLIRGVQTDRINVQMEINECAALSMVIKKKYLEEQIREYERYQTDFINAWEHLTDRERDILNGFFFDKLKTGREIEEELMDKLAMTRSSLYQERRKAVERMKRYVVGA